jgi:RNA polymerase sigma-70 factor (ECF subfamily)
LSPLGPAGGLYQTVPDLEALLAQLVEDARAKRPTIDLDEEAFLAHLGSCLPALGDPAGTLRAIHAGDLWLAFACSLGHAGALQCLEKEHFGEIARWIKSGDAVFVDEVTQSVRAHLLVGEPETPPRIASYSGRGPLGAWIRVVALRLAATLRRNEQAGAVAGERADLDLSKLAGGDPERALLLAGQRREAEAALATAAARLTTRERNLLRLYFGDNLTVEQIAPLYRVHHSTISRWIARARQTLLDETVALLDERLSLSSAGLAALFDQVGSQLDVSLRLLLGDRAD